MTDLDPDKIMAEHHGHSKDSWTPCLDIADGHCLPYRLAAENAALRAEFTAELDQVEHDRDEAIAENAALRAAIGRARDLATDWSDAACEARSDRLGYRAANRQLRAALALPEGKQ